MFTGIIEETGEIVSIEAGAKSFKLTIRADVIFGDLKTGDSVAVNGVCLTAAQINGNTFTADVMPQTVRNSSLGALSRGGRVNLERAMLLNGRFGGHIVLGHIDGTGKILRTRREDNAVWVTIAAPENITKYIADKGSIAVDGISLTAAEVFDGGFSVSIIPHTGSETTLLDKRAGDIVNLECDIIGKYIEKLTNNSAGITEEFLRKYDF